MNDGGAEKVFSELCNYLFLKKYDINLVLGDSVGENLPRLNKSIKIVDLKTKKISRSIPKLVKFLLRNKPKVAISAMTHCNLALIISCLIYRLITNNKIRIIVSERAPISFLFPTKNSLFNRLIILLVKFFYRYSDYIIAVSKGIKEELINYYGAEENKVKVLMNPVQLINYSDQNYKIRPHNWFSQSIPVGISIGRLSEEKGFETLLNVIKRVNEKVQYRHIICGIGKDYNKLIKIAKKLKITENVFFAGYIKDIFLWLKYSDVFVLTSKWEGCPNVILESLASGTPVISTDCPYGPRELLENGKWGKLTKIDSVDELSNEIINTINKSFFKHEEVREYLENNFSKIVIFKQYEKLMFNK